MRPIDRTIVVTLGLFTAPFQIPPALAAASGAAAMEEVVVTARRREENLQDVPMAVSAYSGDDLNQRGASDISAIGELTPSVTIEPSRATNSTLTAFIRGVGQQDPLAGFEQGVALYLDDVYIARPQGALLDIYDVERVEVLRGPQGTLYGRNAVGGAIKYVTRRLAADTAIRVKASLGTYAQQDLVVTASTPVSDGLTLGATIASLNHDGYGDNLTTGQGNYNKEILAFRLSAEYAPTDDLFFRLSYDHTDDDSNPVAGFRPFRGKASGSPVLNDIRDTTAGAAQSVTTKGINGTNNVESEGVHLSAEWTLNDDATLRSVTAHRKDYTLSVIDFDSLASTDFDAPVKYDNKQFSQEFQLLYNAGNLSTIAGLYYLDAEAANDFDVVLGLLHPLGITAYTGGKVDTRAWSIFADLTWDFTDQLSLSVGGRYTDDTRKADIFRANYLGFGSPFFGNTTAALLAVTSNYEAERTFTDFSPRVNLEYSLNDNVNMYAGYSQGWKAGSFDPRGANLVTPSVEKGFEPETLNSYELGIKTTSGSGRARTNVAIFLADYEDMQIPGSLGVDSNGDGINDSFVGAVTNAAKARITGLELEGSYALGDNLSADVAMSFMNASIKNWLVNGVDVSARRVVQNTPNRMINLGLTYHAEVSNGTLVLRGNWSSKGDIVQFETPVAVIDQLSYSIMNASVMWTSTDEAWLAGLHFRNLTDHDVKTAGYCFGSGGCPSTLGLEDNTTVFYGPPRTITATLEYRFQK